MITNTKQGEAMETKCTLCDDNATETVNDDMTGEDYPYCSDCKAEEAMSEHVNEAI